METSLLIEELDRLYDLTDKTPYEIARIYEIEQILSERSQ